MDIDFCPFCGGTHEAQTEHFTGTLRGVTFEADEQFYFCPETGEEFVNGRLMDLNVNRLREAYEKAKSLKGEIR